MSAGPRRRGYGISVSSALTGILFLTAVTLFVLFGDASGTSRSEAFGDPFAEAVPREGSTLLPNRASAPARAIATPERSLDVPGSRPSGTPAPEAGPVATAAPTPRRSGPPAFPAVEPDARRLAAGKQWDASLQAYDRLLAVRPGDAALATERARVLGWSGANGAAAEALGRVIADHGGSSALRLEQARYLWWSGRALAADSAIAVVLLRDPSNAAADSLRRAVREGAAPPSAVAEAWLRDGDGSTDRLRLARAYAREGQSVMMTLLIFY